MRIVPLCIAVAGVLPFLWVAVSGIPGSPTARWGSAYDNHRPRLSQGRLTGFRQRAHWAHQNALESFPLFAAAAILALHAAGENKVEEQLAVAFVALRVLHGLFYVFDRPTLRSASWFASIACALALFAMACR